MTTETLTLSDFLLACIAEDEAAAQMSSGPVWRLRDRDDGYFFVAAESSAIASAVRPEDRAHIARHDPARVLAECEAKRRIVGQVRMWEDWSESDPDRRTALNMLMPIAMMLALPYADRPGYRQEWRP